MRRLILIGMLVLAGCTPTAASSAEDCASMVASARQQVESAQSALQAGDFTGDMLQIEEADSALADAEDYCVPAE
jgi:hypothetical protein